MDLGLTQQNLADHLGIPQQTLAHYAVARARVPASMLPALARLLTISLAANVTGGRACRCPWVVVISALLWDRMPKALFALPQTCDLNFYTSRALLDELADVLSRKKLA
jgi:transcriptional regulator with XRE-family HTH domain